MTQPPCFVAIPHRGLVRVEGPDRKGFLQGLITNDLRALEAGRALYACLLTAQGKFLHDFFITLEEEALLLECEGGVRAQDLFTRLGRYRLRSDVGLSVEENIPVYAMMNSEISGISDPRHPDMGCRTFEKPSGLSEQPFEVWDRHRIMLGIPDGSRDMVPEKSTLLESNIDKFHGVSFEKGCYVGQELTARMHYRGLAKKHLYMVRGEALPCSGTDIRRDGILLGEMRSSCRDVGLALLKDEVAGSLPEGINILK
ncbi:MAG: folate-binding protein [Alphaproteobacteria bacterium]|nr:folate-binding protein [Alphaproteobacteria bacterium]